MSQTSITAAEIPLVPSLPAGIDHEKQSLGLPLRVATHCLVFALGLLVLLLCRRPAVWLYKMAPEHWKIAAKDFWDGPDNWRETKRDWAERSATKWQRDMAREEEKQKKKKKEKKRQRKMRTMTPDLETP